MNDWNPSRDSVHSPIQILKLMISENNSLFVIFFYI
jgi:hypothetical protein